MTSYASHYRYVDSRAGIKLPLAYKPDPGKLYQSVTVLQIPLTLAAGDLLLASAFGQAELLRSTAAAPQPDEAMCCRYLKLTKTGSNAHTEGLILVMPAGHNVTKGEHYSLLPVSAVRVIDAAWAGTVTLMWVMYAANLSQNFTDPRSLPVKYAELQAAVLKP